VFAMIETIIAAAKLRRSNARGSVLKVLAGRQKSAILGTKSAGKQAKDANQCLLHGQGNISFKSFIISNLIFITASGLQH
jgi:hypothetical protein